MCNYIREKDSGDTSDASSTTIMPKLLRAKLKLKLKLHSNAGPNTVRYPWARRATGAARITAASCCKARCMSLMRTWDFLMPGFPNSTRY